MPIDGRFMNGKRLIYLAADEVFFASATGRLRRSFEPPESSSSPCLLAFLLYLFVVLIIFILSTQR
jgi:hypothetical protein